MKVYVDVNVPMYAAGAGQVTPQIRRDSRQLLRLGRRGKVELLASPLVIHEISRTPSRKFRRRATHWLRMSRAQMLPFEWNQEVLRVAAIYTLRGAIGALQIQDARHLAWATVAGADVLSSWNRAHLVRLKTRHQAAIINMQLGYRPIGVELPSEVLREIEKA
jgi:predicted nucleic acid-binding protein